MPIVARLRAAHWSGPACARQIASCRTETTIQASSSSVVFLRAALFAEANTQDRRHAEYATKNGVEDRHDPLRGLISRTIFVHAQDLHHAAEGKEDD